MPRSLLGGGFYQSGHPAPKAPKPPDETQPCKHGHCVNKGSVHAGDHTDRDGSRFQRAR